MYFQEAKQALELMGRWEMIDVCDALELLSPVFESEEVGICVAFELLSPFLYRHKAAWRTLLFRLLFLSQVSNPDH